MNNSTAVKFKLMLCSIITSLALCEIIIRCIAPQPVDYFTFKDNPAPHSSMKQWGMDIKFNAAGMRDVDHENSTSYLNRIAVIGDSITYGTGVEFEDVYHQVLKRTLREQNPAQNWIDLFAYNQGAVSSSWALTTYQTKIRGIKPTVVLLGFCLNDILNYDNEPESGIKELFYDTLAWIHTHARLYSHLYFLVAERSRKLLYQTILDRKVHTIDSWEPLNTTGSNFNQKLKSTTNVLVKLKQAVEADGAKLVVVIFPLEMQVSQKAADIYQKEYNFPLFEGQLQGATQQQLVSEFSMQGIVSIDLLPAFAKASQESDSLFFRELGGMLDWVHPNKEGHAIAAVEILKFLRANNYLVN